MRFVIDTGATSIAIDRANAERIGIDYEGGTPVQSIYWIRFDMQRSGSPLVLRRRR